MIYRNCASGREIGKFITKTSRFFCAYEVPQINLLVFEGNRELFSHFYQLLLV